MKKTIAVLVFPGVELLDFAGPLEILATSRWFTSDPVDCFTAGPEREAITNPSKLHVRVDYLLDDAPVADLVIVPGGGGAHDRHPHTDAVVTYIRESVRRGALVASVCTGTFLLGWAGLLDGRHCTTHRRFRERLATEFPAAIVEDATVVADGPDLVSAANVSSGLDLALYLVGRFWGPEVMEGQAAGLNFATRQEQILEFGGVP